MEKVFLQLMKVLATMTKRLEAVNNVKSNEENRLNFRKTLFSSDSMKELYWWSYTI